jgi:DNA invertase Pin-like site-specific DNA recombinase
MKQAVLYLRVSSQDQLKGDGISRQRREGEAFIAEQGWELAATIVDEGKSAYHGKNRQDGAAFFQFERQARDGFYDGHVLVCENIDRLTRQGAKAAARLVWNLNDYGVDVATWHDNTRYLVDAKNDLLETFGLILKAQMANEEMVNKAKRLRAAWQSRHEKIEQGIQLTKSGRPSMHRPFWIDIEGDHYVLNERAAVVNQIFDWYCDGIGLQAICQMLNEAKVPSKPSYKKEEKGWQKSMLYNILTRGDAIGEYTTRKGVKLSTTYFPAAVSHEKYNGAQAAMIARRRSGGVEMKRGRNVLSGLVRCAQCEGNGVYETQRGTIAKYVTVKGDLREYKRSDVRAFRCDHNRRKLGCTNKTNFKYEIVEKTVLWVLSHFMIEDSSQNRQPSPINEEIGQLEREKDMKAGKLATLNERLMDQEETAI